MEVRQGRAVDCTLGSNLTEALTEGLVNIPNWGRAWSSLLLSSFDFGFKFLVEMLDFVLRFLVGRILEEIGEYELVAGHLRILEESVEELL